MFARPTLSHKHLRSLFRILPVTAGALLLAAGAAVLLNAHSLRSKTPAPKPSPRPWLRQDSPAAQSVWPLPHAVQYTVCSGVTHWLDKSAADGTTVDLFEFDFETNPQLKFAIYDQDEDDSTPLDNKVSYWNMGVGQAVAHLNASGRGSVIAAWNGLFFDLNGQGSTAVANHLTPVVLNGELHYSDLPTYRWTFGVKLSGGKPKFQAVHLPSASDLVGQFDYCSGAAQCVVKDGVALKLQPFPKPGEPIARAHGCAADEAGYIPIVDHMKVSRTSLGWSKDSQRLYLLFVKEPATETESALAFKHDMPKSGGWTLADVQRFWISKGVWGAINSDGGGPAQLTYRLNEAHYVLIPPRWSAANVRTTYSSDFTKAPSGGSLMYFYVSQ